MVLVQAQLAAPVVTVIVTRKTAPFQRQREHNAATTTAVKSFQGSGWPFRLHGAILAHRSTAVKIPEVTPVHQGRSTAFPGSCCRAGWEFRGHEFFRKLFESWRKR